MEETATQQALDEYHRDMRFRAIVLSAVREARDKWGPIDPERAERDACELAELACVLALKRAFDNDAELTAARTERNQYRALALRGLEIAQSRPIVIAKDDHALTA
jgi:hypothetical protein